MLKQVDVTNARGMTLSLELFENDSGYQIADCDGLDPVKATLVSTSFATIAGSQFQSAHREPRNIKLELDLQPDFVVDTYTTLRKRLYTYFMPESQIKLRFHDASGLYVDIVGVVEEHSTPIFSEDPTVNISIMCFQPDLVDPRMVTYNGSTVSTGTTHAIDYPGNVESGTVLTLEVNRTLSSFSIYNTGEDGILKQLDFSGSLLAGDTLVISSLKNNKGLTLTRAGISSSVLYGRSAQSAWIDLIEGINQFRVYATGDPVPYKLEYLRRYGAL